MGFVFEKLKFIPTRWPIILVDDLGDMMFTKWAEKGFEHANVGNGIQKWDYNQFLEPTLHGV